MLVGHGWLRIGVKSSWLPIASLMPAGNMGLEIIAFHPNPAGTGRHPTETEAAIREFVVTGLDPVTHLL
jgi:hypothetical protein